MLRNRLKMAFRYILEQELKKCNLMDLMPPPPVPEKNVPVHDGGDDFTVVSSLPNRMIPDGLSGWFLHLA